MHITTGKGVSENACRCSAVRQLDSCHGLRLQVWWCWALRNHLYSCAPASLCATERHLSICGDAMLMADAKVVLRSSPIFWRNSGLSRGLGTWFAFHLKCRLISGHGGMRSCLGSRYRCYIDTVSRVEACRMFPGRVIIPSWNVIVYLGGRCRDFLTFITRQWPSFWMLYSEGGYCDSACSISEAQTWDCLLLLYSHISHWGSSQCWTVTGSKASGNSGHILATQAFLKLMWVKLNVYFRKKEMDLRAFEARRCKGQEGDPVVLEVEDGYQIKATRTEAPLYFAWNGWLRISGVSRQFVVPIVPFKKKFLSSTSCKGEGKTSTEHENQWSRRWWLDSSKICQGKRIPVNQ